MIRRERRVGRVLALKKRQSLQLKGELAKAQQEVMKAEAYEKKCLRTVDALGKALTAGEARLGRDLLGALEIFELARVERTKANALLEEAQELANERRESALALEREVKSLERVAARLKEARDRQQARREQVQQDELAARMVREVVG